MTPFSARLTFFGFVCLAGAIAANALYFQEPLENRLQSTGSVSEPETRDSLPRAPQSAAEKPAQAAAKGDLQPIAGSADQKRPTMPRAQPTRQANQGTTPTADRAVIRAIQRELAYRNYVVNRRDGQLETSTRLAILNYQYDNGMVLTGQPSQSLLEGILFGPLQAAPDSGRAERLEADQALVARVQRILSRLGFGNLQDHGRLEADTREALRAFAAFSDLPRDGRLSSRLLLALADVTDEPLAGRGIAVSSDVN